MITRVAFAVSLLALSFAACDKCRSSQTPLQPPAGDLGPPTLRLYLLSDVAGALEPCGCTKDQLGGIGHFGAWVRREKARAAAAATAAPRAMVASAGPLFFMDPKLDADHAQQDRTKAETMARVLRGLDFVAFAPGANCWAAGADEFRTIAGESGAAAIVAGEGAPVLRDAGGVRVAFVGYGQSPAVPQGDVEAAVKRQTEEAKKQGANVIVALAAVGRGEAKRIADAVPDLTAVVVGSARSSGDVNTSSPPGEQVGSVVIAQAANHLQSVAVLDLFVRETPPPGKLVTFANASDPRPAPAQGSFFRYTVKEIRESLGSDPQIESELSGYYKAVNARNARDFAGRMPPPAEPGQPKYVGIDVCTSCHPSAREVWNRTPHGHAYATLANQFKEFNLDCVGCHVTGYDKPAGSTVTHTDKLRDVQCEVCHGPGSKHLAAPADETRIVAKPAAALCLDCHHPPHVENFDAQAKMRNILGPGHGMPLR